ncbi:MAG: prepilin peptidase [Firmicutes bacterium]|nr:prepilin peptidase [Bacillota bacterium]
MEIILYISSFALGTVIGSFLNVCIGRIPVGESIINPPSHCPYCNNRLAARDLVPVFSYLWLKGRCRYCFEPVSRQYLVVEILTGLLFLVASWRFGLSIETLVAMVFFSLLVSVSTIDIHHKIIPDGIILTGVILGIPLNFYTLDMFTNGLLGFLTGGGLLLLVAIVSRGGMGGGDIKLAAMAGIYLGWQNVLLMLFLAFLFGSVVGVITVWKQKKTLKEAIPFGPFLALGAVIAFLWGNEIIFWYLHIFS